LVTGIFLLSGNAYTKADRLRKRSEFVHVFQQGRKVQNRHFTAFYCPGQNSASRIGITVTKRVGKAVTRNRIKRIIREHFRLNRECTQPYLDINVIAKKEAVDLTSEEMFYSLNGLFEKIKRACCH
jgi:ribonuclease P protein component